jgi:hypothetical protein
MDLDLRPDNFTKRVGLGSSSLTTTRIVKSVFKKLCVYLNSRTCELRGDS